MKVAPKVPLDAWQVADDETAKEIAGHVGGMYAREVRQQMNGPHHPPTQGYVPCVQINTLQGPKRAYQTDWIVKDDAAVTIYTDEQFNLLFERYPQDEPDTTHFEDVPLPLDHEKD